VIAVLDTCVLYPTVLRQILLGTARAGLIQPLWSARIFEEWRRTAERLAPGDGVFASGEIVRMQATWPDAEIAADPMTEAALWLPDPGDIHVLATAIKGGAATIITLNLKDFPPRELTDHNITARHPDAILYALWQSHPVKISEVVSAAYEAAHPHTDLGLRALLKRARLPRLGKALTR
jgi:predicted nucleic acid-binding protein